MARVSRTFRVDPSDIFRIGIDWRGSDPGPRLADDEAITASTWTVPTGITKLADSFADAETAIVLSEPTAGETYQLSNKIVTDLELTTGVYHTLERTVEVIVEEL